MELVSDIQEWVSSSVSIPVQFISLSVEEFCAVSSSTAVEECPRDDVTTMTTVTTQPMTSQPGPVTTDHNTTPDTSTSFTIPVAVSTAVIVLVAMVIVVLVILLKCRCHSSDKK